MSPERNHLFYIANLGSEVSRYLDCIVAGNTVESKRAWDRMEKIKTSLNALTASQSAQAEITCLFAFIAEPNCSQLPIQDIKRECADYFTPFALRLMAQ